MTNRLIVHWIRVESRIERHKSIGNRTCCRTSVGQQAFRRQLSEHQVFRKRYVEKQGCSEVDKTSGTNPPTSVNNPPCYCRDRKLVVGSGVNQLHCRMNLWVEHNSYNSAQEMHAIMSDDFLRRRLKFLWADSARDKHLLKSIRKTSTNLVRKATLADYTFQQFRANIHTQSMRMVQKKANNKYDGQTEEGPRVPRWETDASIMGFIENVGLRGAPEPSDPLIVWVAWLTC